MFSGTTIIGLIIVLLCIIPIVLMFVSSKKKKARALNALKELATESNKKVAQFDQWKENAIGTDEAHTMIFAVRKMKDSVLKYAINLSGVRSCKVINRSRTVKFEGGNTTLIEQLSLQFEYKDPSKGEMVLDFYHNGYDTVAIADELLLIQKWEKLIQDALNKN